VEAELYVELPGARVLDGDAEVDSGRTGGLEGLEKGFDHA
jgi:hypothetical protein